jgi:tRNA nucleotidyltransferase/poly(A) polymerase
MRLALRDGRLADLSALRSPPLARALALLNGGGEEARLVGGAVRDLLLGQSPGDYDLTTTATPKVVMARAKAAGVAFAPTGVKHGTVTLLIDGRPIEVTTLREDIETDGRRAKVRFGRDFFADARRRDFTINALSLDAEGRVRDEVGGLADLEAGRVRFIGAARERIREDYLRILRFLRFSARFGDGRLDAEGFAAAIAERAGLATLSAERVRAELLKILATRRGAAVLAEADAAGLIGPLLGGVALPARLAKVVAIETARAAAPDALLRLAAFAVLVREDAGRSRERLRLSNAESGRLEAAARALEALHGFRAPPPFGELRVLLFERGRPAAADALTLAHADSGAAADDPAWLSAHRFLADTPAPRMPFTGADLVARGVAPGRGVGEALKRLQANWIRAGFPREPDALARLLADALEEEA